MQIQRSLAITLSCIAILWAVYFVGLVLPVDIRIYGIRPRRIDGLPGLIFSPFLHFGLRHLLSNTLALAPLLFFSLTYSIRLTMKAVIIIALIGGAGVWLFGQSHTVHIGSSGIAFGLIGYLLAIGLFRKELLAVLVSCVVAFYYGWVLYSLVAVLPGVSWTGHFFGFASGVLAAWSMKQERQ
ncbi:MAG: rhomboid family intramembrane serine protease [Syntrophobacteraceae bacterium]